jgi:hypothetical protein
MLGAGGSDKTGEAVLKRQLKNKQAAEGEEARGTEQPSLPAQKVKDASAGAYKDYQMQQAIEEVRKKKTAQRSAY